MEEMSRDPEEDKSQFYDVNKFKEIIDFDNQTRDAGLLRSVVNWLWRDVDSLVGVIYTFFGLAVVFASPLVVVFLGVLYGPLAFLGSLLGVMGLLGSASRGRLEVNTIWRL